MPVYRSLPCQSRINVINYNVVRDSAATGILHVVKEDGQTNLADPFIKILPCRRRYDLFSRIGYSSMLRDLASGIKRNDPPSPKQTYSAKKTRFVRSLALFVQWITGTISIQMYRTHQRYKVCRWDR